MNKFKKYQGQRNSLEYAIRKIESIQNPDLPKEAKEVIKETLEKLKKITITPPGLMKVSGDLLDPTKVKDLLEDATEYKWRVVPKEEIIEYHFDLNEGSPKKFVADNYGMEVEDKDVQLLGFYRNTDNRSELCRVDIVCIPGHFQCNWANDRASVGDDMMPNLKFEKFIKKLG